MARKPRIHFPGALYPVIARGNRRQGIFLDEKDLQRFLVYLPEYKNRFPFRLYAYALLKNPLHLLIEVEEIPLSSMMQSLLDATGRWGTCFRDVTRRFCVIRSVSLRAGPLSSLESSESR